jgi:hypothetical protein
MSGRTAAIAIASNTLKIQDSQGNDQNVVQIEAPGTDTLTLSAEVTFSGALAPFFMALGVQFQVDYLFTPIGPGSGGRFVNSPITVTTVAGLQTYNDVSTPSTKLTLDTSAAQLPPPGVYEVAARVTFVTGNPPLSAITDNEIDLEIFS